MMKLLDIVIHAVCVTIIVTMGFSNITPDFSCDLNDGSTFVLKDKKKPVFINFWATWCGPCVGEMPDLQNVYDEYKDKIDFVFINCGGSQSDIDKFVQSSNVKYTIPIGFDKDNAISSKFGVRSIPRTIILDSDKRVACDIVGARRGEDYVKEINKVLKK